MVIKAFGALSARSNWKEGPSDMALKTQETKRAYMTCFWSKPSGTGMPQLNEVREMLKSCKSSSWATIWARRSSGKHAVGVAA